MPEPFQCAYCLEVEERGENVCSATGQPYVETICINPDNCQGYLDCCQMEECEYNLEEHG
uniref:Uncharacterized protein n=1 Tax=viral metagenome TaxID=1070528 RepID=A0A6M3K629_9ZZZZ